MYGTVMLLVSPISAWADEGNFDAEPFISLYGQRYDITQIATWHPGGAAILRQVRSLRLSDATPLFESEHALRDPDEMINKLIPYRVNGTVSSPRLYTFHETGFYRVLRRRVAAHLKSLGLTDGTGSWPSSPRPVHLAAPKGGPYLVLKYLFFMSAVVVLLRASVRAKHTSTAALVAFAGGFGLICAQFVLLHDASHFAAFERSIETTTFASCLTQTVGFWDHPSWRAHHVLQHHAFTGDPTRDPDLRHGNPYFCKVEEAYSCNPATPRLQFLTALSSMHTGQLFIYLGGPYGSQRAWDGWKTEHAIGLGEALRGVNDERWAWWQFAVALWPLVFLCAHFRSARAQGVSRRGAATRALVAFSQLVLGMNVCYAANILIDHDSLTSTQNLDGHLDAYGTSPSDWGEIQVRATGNWAGPVWCFFFGGINYQIEHHLFPTIFHEYYPQVAPVVRATAEEFNISYTSFDTVSSGLASVLAQLSAAADAATKATAAAEAAAGGDAPFVVHTCGDAVAERCLTPVPTVALDAVQMFVILNWTLFLVCAGACAKTSISSAMRWALPRNFDSAKYVKMNKKRRCDSEKLANNTMPAEDAATPGGMA